MNQQPKKTRFQLHCEAWEEGCGSEFCAGAMKKVFYRGNIPCDILFVGEAPGKTENMLGQPFKGVAGKLLDRIVTQGVPKGSVCPICKQPCLFSTGGVTCKNGHGGVVTREEFKPNYRVGFCNIVACIPRLQGEEKVEPDADQIEMCKPRLEEIIEIANPKLIFAVGNHSRDALTQGYLHSTKIPDRAKVVHIVHPAYILRQTVAFQGLEIQRVVCAVRDAIAEMEKPPKRLELPPELKTGKSNTKDKNSAIINEHWTKSQIPNLDDDIPF